MIFFNHLKLTVLNKKRVNDLQYLIFSSFISLSLILWDNGYHYSQWRRGVGVTTTAQLHSTKPELMFCAGSKPARGVSEIRDGEDL